VDKLRIEGGHRLRGTVQVGGAKNAALPALAACLLTGEEVELRNLPRVRDVRTMLRVLEQLGAAVTPDESAVRVRTERFGSFEAPYDLVKTMRASVLVLGPLLARHGRARVSLPGGCAIGERPIDFHLAGLRRMGAEVAVEHGYVEATAKHLRGARIAFPVPSVTATENLMMAAALAEGTTVLENCAREPEVVDLGALLSAMGGSLQGVGTERIEIEGRPSLHGAAHTVIPDRIEAGTYVVAAVAAGEDVTVSGCRPGHLTALLQHLEDAGADLTFGEDWIRVRRDAELRAASVETEPYPGFPTDMQAQCMALATQARGDSVLTETIFEKRFMHVGELRRMGAQVHIDGRKATVTGPTRLTGAQTMATDLRASACLVVAALVADGVTVVDRVYHLDRGYESMETKLQALGAAVERIR